MKSWRWKDKDRGQRLGAAIAVAALSGWCATACSPAHLDLCERAASCGGGRELEVDACVADMDRREELAVIYGCEPTWEDYVACLEERGYCDDRHLGGCDPLRDNYNHCIDANELGQAKVESEPVDGPVEPAEPWAADADADAPKPKKKCSVTHAGASRDGAGPTATWLLAAGLGLALLRRRRQR